MGVSGDQARGWALLLEEWRTVRLRPDLQSRAPHRAQPGHHPASRLRARPRTSDTSFILELLQETGEQGRDTKHQHCHNQYVQPGIIIMLVISIFFGGEIQVRL